MTKMLIINSKTRIITNIVEADDNYEPPHGRELVKGRGNVGEVFKAKPKKAST